MFCQNCGSEIPENENFCSNCGKEVNLPTDNKVQQPLRVTEYDTSKAGAGVLLALFSGLVGLIIGLLLYPSGTVARKTFLQGWGITVFISTIIALIFVPSIITSIVDSYSKYY